MRTIQGGQVCINVNGQRTSYFKTYQRLRQGDPLSPLMFNIIADSLSKMLDKAKELNLIQGIVGHLIPGGITHVQYTDDTILMTEGDDVSILHIKFILYCFEWLSGLKINYHKSEAYVFGMEEEEKHRIANMLNCELGSLPIKYFRHTTS